MEENKMRDFMKSDYGDNKVDKSSELNETMSITEQAPDDYTKKINSIEDNANE